MMPKRLATKLILSLTVIVVIVEGFASYLNIRDQERQLLDAMVLGADQLSQSITSATWHAMLADNRGDAYEVMQTIAEKQGIRRIRIFNKEGRIMFSTAPEAGQLVDKNAEACVLCHKSASPLVRVETPSRARVFPDPGGQRRLAMITPIYNEPSCSSAACHAHPARQRVLGVLDVALDLSPVDRRLASTRDRILLTTALEVLAMSGFLVVFIALLVTRPIHRLVEANAALGRMDLEHPVEITSSRELYVAPFYNHVIAEHGPVGYDVAETVYPIGTPEELQRFLEADLDD